MAANSTSRFLADLNKHAGHMDFDSVTAAYGIVQMSSGVQRNLGDLVLSLVNAWAEMEPNSTSDHPNRNLFELCALMVQGMNEPGETDEEPEEIPEEG
jgi:hypothetical protein